MVSVALIAERYLSNISSQTDKCKLFLMLRDKTSDHWLRGECMANFSSGKLNSSDQLLLKGFPFHRTVFSDRLNLNAHFEKKNN